MPIFTYNEIEQSYHDLGVHQTASELIIAHSTNQQDIREFALQSVDFSRVKNILDLGCGFGFSTLGLKGKIKKNSHIVGFDIQDVYQKPFLGACRQIGAIGEFHVSDVAELASYPSQTFDLILSSYSLYFFPEVIKDIAKVLTDDGTFVAITHSQETLNELIRYIPPTMESLGLHVPDLLSIQKLLGAFSYENGDTLLKPYFDKIEKRLFLNKLRFRYQELPSVETYLRMKQHLLLKEIRDTMPDSIGTALSRVMTELTKEAKEKGVIEFNKNDAVFICRCPTVPREKITRPPAPQYCIACGNRLAEKKIEGKLRPICSMCGNIVYENPLPVVSAVVVNDRKQVLLVKRARHPMKGMWCLPCGFAESDEHIEEAVLRELEEETNITGIVKRLLDATTARNYFYGNLVMMSFEITDVQGTPSAGTDADDVKFFHLDRLPVLAFPSHEHAIQKYIDLYRDTWAIESSSVFALPDQEDTHAHVSDVLVAAVEKQAHRITMSWLDEVTSSPHTPHYRTLPREILSSRVDTILNHLGDWLRTAETSAQVESFYRSLGAERRGEGFPLEEVLMSFKVLRKKIIINGQAAIHKKSILDLYTLTEFQMRIINFFDRVLFHIVKGFGEK